VQGRYFSTVGFSINQVAFGGLVMVAFRHHRLIDDSRVGRLIARIGVDTYAIYLWHMFAKRAFSYLRRSGYVDLPYLVEFAGYIILSVGLGMLVTKLLEQPVLAIRDRWIPSRSGQLT
jgi:peptidoglycan/LPS O-acetylase OafA/YrhL